MLFKEKSNNIKFVKYTEDRKKVDRRITFKKDLAEETNKTIAVFNNENEVVKLNSTILVNIALNCFFKQLENLSEEKAIEYLERRALEEAKK